MPRSWLTAELLCVWVSEMENGKMLRKICFHRSVPVALCYAAATIACICCFRCALKYMIVVAIYFTVTEDDGTATERRACKTLTLSFACGTTLAAAWLDRLHRPSYRLVTTSMYMLYMFTTQEILRFPVHQSLVNSSGDVRVRTSCLSADEAPLGVSHRCSTGPHEAESGAGQS